MKKNTKHKPVDNLAYHERLRKAVQQELKRSATSTMDAILLKMLRRDYEEGDWNTERMRYVKRKHEIETPGESNE